MDYKVEEKSRELAQLILESEEYNNYIEAKNRLVQNVEISERVSRFRKLNFELQNGENTEQMMERLMKLSQEYQQELEEPVVIEYLNAELRLCKMMQNVNEMLVEKIEMDMGFLA